ncbi:MAG: 30S ribosomal protein S4 [Myxococcota bacterium]
MARYIGPVCRICRREGLKLFLKGDRCYTEKCGIERRAYAPGQHGQGHRKRSDYGVQLREKQKVRRMYGLLEKQFRRNYVMADRMKGVTGENLLRLLETRLDNVVFRLGFAVNRSEARQLVQHNLVTLNGHKANIPSMTVKVGDVIDLKPRARKHLRSLSALESVDRRGLPQWLELDRKNFRGSMTALPEREDVTMPIEEHLIVELYSK